MDLGSRQNQFDLRGLHVLVTGASDGLGAEISRAIARSGGKVSLAARRLEKLNELQMQIADEGGHAFATLMDVEDEKSVSAAFDSAEQQFGRIDGLVANAGISFESPVLDQSLEQFDQTVSVNLRGVFLTVREAGQRMLSTENDSPGHGKIVINASYTAHKVSSNLSAYSASKAGAVQFGRVAAREWAKNGINVNMLCPGYLSTPMTSEFFASNAGVKFASRFPRGRVMPPDALNDLTLFLLSDASKYITGSVFSIDDGQSL
nr:SDR family oxidoreductase [Hyphomonas sp. Mor2]